MRVGKKHGFKMKETECVILENIGKTILRAEKKIIFQDFSDDVKRANSKKFFKIVYWSSWGETFPQHMEKYVNKIFYKLISERVLPENIFPLTSRVW